MRAVGIRELKNQLSHYVRLVEAGESVLVTHRGTVVAELRPPDPTKEAAGTERHDARLLEFARRGRIAPGAPHDPDLYHSRPRLLPPGRLQELLDAERTDD